jgi:hypothetical protein
MTLRYRASVPALCFTLWGTACGSAPTQPSTITVTPAPLDVGTNIVYAPTEEFSRASIGEYVVAPETDPRVVSEKWISVVVKDLVLDQILTSCNNFDLLFHVELASGDVREVPFFHGDGPCQPLTLVAFPTAPETTLGSFDLTTQFAGIPSYGIRLTIRLIPTPALRAANCVFPGTYCGGAARFRLQMANQVVVKR